MKRLAVFIVIMLILIVGGGLTSQFAASDGGTIIPGVLQQTTSPEASTLVAEPWQAQQLFLLIGFVLVNLIGIALTLALIFWFLDRGVRNAKAAQTAKAARDRSTAQ